MKLDSISGETSLAFAATSGVQTESPSQGANHAVRELSTRQLTQKFKVAVLSVSNVPDCNP
jgi:hypothetical protein